MKMKYKAILFSTIAAALLFSFAAPAGATFTQIVSPGDPLGIGTYVTETTKIDITGIAEFTSLTSITDGTMTVTFSTTMERLQVGSSWSTWGSPPDTESATPPVLFSLGATTVNMDLSQPVQTFGFEAEPDPFADEDFTVDFKLFSGPTLVGTVSRTINGSGGARLIAGTSDSTPFDRIEITSTADFAIAQVRYNIGSTVSSLSDGHYWVGLRNSDDQGTQYDIREQFLQNGVVVATGIERCITSLTRNPTKAFEAIVAWNAFGGVPVTSGDVLGLTISTRIGTNPDGTKCAGPGGSHNNARGLRLYYDSAGYPSHFDATISPNPNEILYLHSDRSPCHDNNGESSGIQPLTLDGIAPTASFANKKCKDSGPINFNNGNPWVDVGTWLLAPLP